MQDKKQILLNIIEFATDTSAVTAMEYGLIAALIAVVVITGLTTLGTNLETTFVSVGASI